MDLLQVLDEILRAFAVPNTHLVQVFLTQTLVPMHRNEMNRTPGTHLEETMQPWKPAWRSTQQRATARDEKKPPAASTDIDTATVMAHPGRTAHPHAASRIRTRHLRLAMEGGILLSFLLPMIP